MAYQGYEGYGSPNLSARERAALALLQRQRAVPKNIGEGLNAIGESIGDRMIMDRMAREEKEAAARSAADFAEYQKRLQPAAPLAAAAPAAVIEPATRSAAPAVPIEEGGYNLIDAQAGARGTPGALQPGVFDAIQRNIQDPDRQALAARISGREQPLGGPLVSPTGAAGPYQFTQGTGRDYGLPTRAAREDVDASTVAFDKFTNDNARIFERINGRPPTPAEIAVMHQQGGTTGARMIAGTGNAPARNLAVNNVAPGSNPQQAVAAIKGYYGLPDDPRAQAALTLSSRNRDPRLAAAMAATEPAPGVPPVNPTMPAAQPPMSGPAPSISQTPGPGGPGLPNQQIAQAPQAALPPPNQRIQPAPPQMLQPPPRAEPSRPPEARMQPPTDAETAAQLYMSHPNAGLATRAKADFERLYNERKAQFASDLIESRAAQQRWDEKQAQATDPKRIADLEKAQLDLKKAQTEAAELQQFNGMNPAAVHKKMDESSKVAASAARSLEAAKEAMKVYEKGTFHGSGAEWKLMAAKAATGVGLVDYTEQIKNTEVFVGAMQPIIAAILHQTSGTSQLTENELLFAKNAAAGNINLDPASVKELMRIINKGSQGVIESHQTKMDALFPNNPQARAMYGVEAPKMSEREPPVPAASTGRVNVDSEADALRLPPGTKFRLSNGRTGTAR